MKKLIAHAALLAIFVHPVVFSQSGWVWLNPLPQGNYLTNVSYVNSSLVYVSGYGGTLMKSTNGGLNFSVVPTGIRESLSLNFINELTGFSPAGSGILRTTDGGYHWQYFQLPTDYETDLLQFLPTSTLFALKKKNLGNIPNVLFRSTDLGVTWFESLNPDSNIIFNSYHFPNSSTGYAVGKKPVFNQYSKIYRTTNAGVSWDSVASTIKYELRTVNFLNSNTGFVSTYGYRNLILKTTNACQSWDTVNHGSFFSIKFFNNLSGYAGEGTAVIALTTNSGLNWQNVYLDNKLYLNDINNGLGLIASYFQNFIYRTTNSGNNWTQVTQGFYDSYLFDVTFVNESTGFAAGSSKIYKTTNGGLSWIAYELNLQGYNSVESLDFINENTGYAGIDEARIGKTTNCGVNWTIYQTGYFDHNFGISFPSLDTGYSVTKYGNYLKTTNGGVNWSTLGWRQGHHLQDVYFINNSTGFAGGDSSDFGFIRRTTDGGQTWTLTVLDSIYWINDVGVSDEATWFAAGYGFNYGFGILPGLIYRSTDAGLNWNYTKFPHLIGAIYFPTKLIGYASTYGNMMYKTTNGGDNWFATESISANESYGIFFTNENTGYAVGYGGQIIKTTTGGGNIIGVNPVSNEVPMQFILHQNYPNPFNPVTKIGFALPPSPSGEGKDAPMVRQGVRVVIYDILGREITTLINEQLNPGLYEVTWDGTNYPSGVYFYRLTTSDFTQTRKMVLLK